MNSMQQQGLDLDIHGWPGFKERMAQQHGMQQLASWTATKFTSADLV